MRVGVEIMVELYSSDSLCWVTKVLQFKPHIQKSHIMVNESTNSRF